MGNKLKILLKLGVIVTVLGLVWHKTMQPKEEIVNFLEGNFNATLSNRELLSVSDEDSIIVGDQNKKPVRVLLWTKFFRRNPFQVLEIYAKKNEYQPQVMGCEVPCEFTADRKLINSSDAVVFHNFDISEISLFLTGKQFISTDGKMISLFNPQIKSILFSFDILTFSLTDLPTPRIENQVWVYLNLESPHYTYNTQMKNIIFNWTMTYRKDSDIYHPYGEIVPNLKPKPSSVDNELNKSKLVAWVVSRCNSASNREGYISELSNYIPVDIYGRCGNLTCLSKGQGNCFPQIEKEYKFYISFENSLCLDYVTEKFFLALNRSIVPIVFGHANYSQLAPIGSYIDIRDFKTPKHLADYLIYLDNNPIEYLKYFNWKNSFEVTPGNGWCNLCRKLKNSAERKWYPNVWEWWTTIQGAKEPGCVPGWSPEKITSKPDYHETTVNNR